MLERGRVPDDPLPEVACYLDWRAFGALPSGGGVMDQPAWIMDGMREIHSRVGAAEERRARAQQAGGR